MTKSVNSNLEIIFNYLKKGKQVDKVILSFNKILKISSNIVSTNLEHYLEILSSTTNKVLFEKGIVLLYSSFNKNNLKNAEHKEFVYQLLEKFSMKLIQNAKALNYLFDQKKGEAGLSKAFGFVNL